MNMKILANDGISPEGIEKLTSAGFTVVTEKVEKDNLADAINKEGYAALLVRSATTVRKDLIDACPGLKFIGRGGVGMDNIDVAYAREKGITVENTPASSSQSVAELVMGSMFSLSRSLYDSHLNMPSKGATEFKVLKKKYAKGVELKGKTLAIVGFGRIGQALASYALGSGMKVLAVNIEEMKVAIPLLIEGMEDVTVNIDATTNMEKALSEADYISLHVPKQSDGKPVFGEKEFNQMKDGVRIVNASRGGVVDEDALLKALESGKVANVALDVFDNEPTPREDLLKHNKIASTPHIGAATVEAQARIGLELADKIIETLS